MDTSPIFVLAENGSRMHLRDGGVRGQHPLAIKHKAMLHALPVPYECVKIAVVNPPIKRF